MSYERKSGGSHKSLPERINTAERNQFRDFQDQNKITSKPRNLQTRAQSDVNSQPKRLFEDFVNSDLIVNRVLTDKEELQPQTPDQNFRGVKLITVTPMYIISLHLITHENQFFGIYKDRFCFYDFSVQGFIGTINHDGYTEAAERITPHLEKRAPWLFDDQEELRREDPVVLLTKPQDFNTAYVLLSYLHSTFPRDLQREFDECLRSSHPNVVRFVERNKERLCSGIDPRFYHKVSSLILGATIMDGQNRLILAQIESSLADRLMHNGSQKCFIADESIFRKSFMEITSRDLSKSQPNKMAQVKFNYGIFRQRKSTAVVGNKRGYNTDVVEIYEEYFMKLMRKQFPTNPNCVVKMNQLIDADLRYSRFPGLILYVVSHGLSMLEQTYFGRRLQNSQVPSRPDRSSVSPRPNHSNRSRSSSRSDFSRRSKSSSRSEFSSSGSFSASRSKKGSREGRNSHQRAHNSPDRQSPRRSTLSSERPIIKQYRLEEERTNRFDRPLLSELEDHRNSPLHSRSNSLVITDVTYPENQAADVGSSVAKNANQVGQKRHRDPENASDAEGDAKRRKTDINLVGINTPNEKCDTAPTNVEPLRNQEPATDELLELLNSWQ